MTFVNHHYEQFFDGDFQAFRKRQPVDLWCYTNADFIFVRPLETVGFHVVRDPRDVIVSGYFSHLKSHPDAGWPRLRWYRPYLQSLPKHEGLLREMEFSSIFLSQMLSWGYGEKPSILEFRFEDMIADQFATLRRVLTHMRLMPSPIDASALEAILSKYTFEKLSGGRSPGHEDAANHYRRGIPGDWRNHFQNGHIAYFKSLYNPLLLKLGYERREDWT